MTDKELLQDILSQLNDYSSELDANEVEEWIECLKSQLTEHLKGGKK